MSSALAIGAVSAVLKNLLDNGIVEQVALGTTVNVSAVAPDTIRLDAPEDPPQLNVFLHQVTPNAAWRNRELPSRASNGDRLTNPPLALDLHYLITAYGRSDFQAEILLGYAMHLLHERPMLDRPAIRRALDPSPLDVSMLPPAFQALTASDLADQVEAIRITPIAMPVEEMSKLWSAIQTHYRPSAAYQVSVGTSSTRRNLRGIRCRYCRVVPWIRSLNEIAALSSTRTCYRRCQRCSTRSRRPSRQSPGLEKRLRSVASDCPARVSRRFSRIVW